MTELPTDAVPPRSVLDAFGVAGRPVPLDGGQGRSVLVGGYVFKPADGPEDETEWATALFEGLAPDSGLRVPRPLRAMDGRCAVDGWTAGGFLTGRTGPRGHWAGVLAAGRAFHAALRHSPRPGFLDRRTHPWAVADRVAWGEQDVGVLDGLAAPFATLLELRRPVDQSTAQLVHGDLAGNVLFAPGEPPAVIDFSPYWRPPAFAEAVALMDGLLWYGLPPGLLTAGGTSARPPTAAPHPDRHQLLLRALLFRLVAYSELVRSSGRPVTGEAERYARAADVVARMRPTS
ncbi:aminoglycoside phosphotransferase [Streptomyces sp. NPDC059785]|uniref:aminoglycoside phosphotransferase n=1 Tax=unclassified Streptomyces TaxID=2593676 RepID=UPI003646CD28